jgi:intracellular multiplication protein IcmP
VRSPPNPRATWPSGDDDTGFNLIVILVGCCLGAWLLWTNYHAEISAAVMALHHREIAVIQHFTGRYNQADAQMAKADPAGVTLRDLTGVAHDVGMFFRIPAAGFLLVLALICTVRAAPSRYRRVFDLDGLIGEQAISFRTTAAFAGRRLRLVPPAAAPLPADYAVTAGEWIARHATDGDGRFNEPAARCALALQLGPPWRGLDHAQPHVRCLFAVFALQLAERRDEALGLLGELSAALASPGKDTPEGPGRSLALPDWVIAQAGVVLRQHELVAPALAITGRHAFTHTALMSLLNEARRSAGVLAPGQFVWLKLVDRGLWYALHSLGFETEGLGRYLHPNPRVEAIGARDHWAVERLAGVPVSRPSLDRAIEALREAAAARKTRAGGS